MISSHLLSFHSIRLQQKPVCTSILLAICQQIAITNGFRLISGKMSF